MVELTKDNFQEEVLDASGYVLVDFWSDGCEPCKALMPDVVALSEEFSSIKFSKLNTGKARRLAISQRVLGLPTLILYKDGEKVAEVTKDDATKAGIKGMIEANI